MKLGSFWKLFHLPSPKELGWSDTNSLPMKSFSTERPTWEDWEEKVKKDYPIKYFFAKTLRKFFRYKILNPLRRIKTWFESHFIPSKRYHMLDLRQPESHDTYAYRYGWIDADSKILYAIFNILNEFVRDEMPHFHCPSEEEIQNDPLLTQQRNIWFEVKSIHYWWNIERIRTNKLINNLSQEWYHSRQANGDDDPQLWEELKKTEKQLENKTEEMISRLMKIRGSLWT